MTKDEIRTNQRAVLAAVITDRETEEQAAEYLDELEFLAHTADIDTVRRVTQRLSTPNSRIYMGPGKLDEIAAWCSANEIDVVIFDDELSPSQTRNIEKILPCRVPHAPHSRHLYAPRRNGLCQNAGRTRQL